MYSFILSSLFFLTNFTFSYSTNSSHEFDELVKKQTSKKDKHHSPVVLRKKKNLQINYLKFDLSLAEFQQNIIPKMKVKKTVSEPLMSTELYKEERDKNNIYRYKKGIGLFVGNENPKRISRLYCANDLSRLSSDKYIVGQKKKVIN